MIKVRDLAKIYPLINMNQLALLDVRNRNHDLLANKSNSLAKVLSFCCF